MSGLPDWLYTLRERLPALIESYAAGQPGWYRLCNAGNLIEPGPQAGLGFSCYAAKVTVQCGLWMQLSTTVQQAWIEHIQSFQHHDSGLFIDPTVEKRGRWLYMRSLLRHGPWIDLFRPNWRNRWAETRQAMATLFAMGSAPRYLVRDFPASPVEINRFLNRLNWENPWAAGAQVSHLLFFVKHGNISEQKGSESRQTILSYLNHIESEQTGGWYKGSISNQQIINGAMKIISGLYWWNEPVRYANPLVQSALAEVSNVHDCALTNRLFVLYRLGEQLGCLPESAKDVARKSLSVIPEFIQADGGISSSQNGTLKRYYYAPASEGKPAGDLHGLTLLTWAITLAAHILGKQNELGWHPIPP